MKNIVRAFVVTLFVTGAIASAHTKLSAENIKPTLSASYPLPTCPPDDPGACGMGGGNK